MFTSISFHPVSRTGLVGLVNNNKESGDYSTCFHSWKKITKKMPALLSTVVVNLNKVIYFGVWIRKTSITEKNQLKLQLWQGRGGVARERGVGGGRWDLHAFLDSEVNRTDMKWKNNYDIIIQFCWLQFFFTTRLLPTRKAIQGLARNCPKL